MRAIGRGRRGALALALLFGLGLSSCGSSAEGGGASSNASTHTPEAYCEAFYSRAAPLRDAYSAAGSADPVTGLLAAITAPGRLATVFADMARHAPDDIAADTEAVRDALRKVQDSVGDSVSNPLAAIAKGAVAGAAAGDSFDRVGRYLEAHCPLDSAIARRYVKRDASSAATTKTAAVVTTPTGSAPAVGTQLAAPTGDGAFSVVTNADGDGFSIVRDLVDINTNEDSSTVTTYDVSGAQLAEIPSGSLAGDCQAADIVRADGSRIILTIASSTTPAKGIQAARSASQMDAWDAATGRRLWSTHLYDEQASCDPVNGTGDGIIGFAPTPDGRWGILAAPDGTLVIDLATGEARLSRRELHVTGNVLAVPAEYSPLNSAAFDPQTLAKVGAFAGFQFYGDPDMAPTGLLKTDSEGSSPPAGSSEDGTVVFGVSDDRIVAYSVPSMRVLWKGTKVFNPYLFGEAGGILLTTSQEDDAKLVALDVKTGRRLWSDPAGEVCGFTRKQLLLAVNGQLATLDMKTGRQLSYSDQGDTCPDIRAGGIGVESGSEDPTQEHGVTVTQVLEP